MPIDRSHIPDWLGPIIEVAGPPTILLDVRVGRPLQARMPPQLLSNWCWAATTSCIRDFYGEKDAGEPCEIATAWLGFPCCPPDADASPNNKNRQYDLGRALGKNIAKVTGPADFNTVKGQVLAERPLCCVIRWPSGDQHFNVIVDFDEKSEEILVRDPKYGECQVPIDEFSSRYRGTGKWMHTLFTQPRP